MEHLGSFEKYQCLGPIPLDCDLLGLGYSLNTGIFKSSQVILMN